VGNVGADVGGVGRVHVGGEVAHSAGVLRDRADDQRAVVRALADVVLVLRDVRAVATGVRTGQRRAVGHLVELLAAHRIGGARRGCVHERERGGARERECEVVGRTAHAMSPAGRAGGGLWYGKIYLTLNDRQPTGENRPFERLPRGRRGGHRGWRGSRNGPVVG